MPIQAGRTLRQLLQAPTLRFRAAGELGLYPNRDTDAHIIKLNFDQNLAAPLCGAVAVVLAIVALADLLDD